MSLSRINNQLVKLYTPEETTFNEQTGKCKWFEKYYQKVTCEDVTQIVLQSEAILTDNLSDDPIVDNVQAGAITAEATDKLIDSGADFDGTGGTGNEVYVGMTVKNTDTDQFATIVSVDSATQITLSTDIMNLVNPNYSISYYEIDGNVSFGTNEIQKTSGFTGSIEQTNVLEVGGFYMYEFDISSFEFSSYSDSITVKIGGQTVAVLTAEDDPTGTLTFYGNAANTADISIEFDSNIVADLTNFNIYNVTKPVFYIKDCETDETVYTSIDGDIDASFVSEQVLLKIDWSNLLDGYDCNCGCYYIEIHEDVAYSEVVFRTDCFQLCESFECNIKLTGSNNDNAFGIDFVGLNYEPVLRVDGGLETPKYNGDKENEEDSAGVSKTLYFKSEKEVGLFIYAQPEHIHDFIRLLIGYDNLYIEDVEYLAKEASYSPEGERLAGKLLSLYNATTNLRLKNDLNENKYC